MRRDTRNIVAMLSIIFSCSAVLLAAKDKHTSRTHRAQYYRKMCFMESDCNKSIHCFLFIEAVLLFALWARTRARQAEIRNIFSEADFFTLTHTSQIVFGPYYFMRQNPSTAKRRKKTILESIWNVRVAVLFLFFRSH